MTERKTLAAVDAARTRMYEAQAEFARALRDDIEARSASRAPETVTEYEVSREMQRVIIERMKYEGIPARQAWREKDIMALGLRCAALAEGAP